MTEITIEFEETKYLKFPIGDLKSNQVQLYVNIKEGQAEIEYFFDNAGNRNGNYEIDSYPKIVQQIIQIKDTEISIPINIPRESKNLNLKIRGLENLNILKIKLI